jgi:hypothetical protein
LGGERGESLQIIAPVELIAQASGERLTGSFPTQPPIEIDFSTHPLIDAKIVAI